MTMALTLTQWRTVVESVWATAQAVRLSISRLTKGKALVSLAQRAFEQQLQLNNYKTVLKTKQAKY